MLFLTLFIFGLIFGSFSNALVWRLHTNQTLGGRSMCPQCGATIHWYDNIPVISFMWLRARCRNCKKRISWQYPIVELLMAIGFVIVGQSVNNLVLFGVDWWTTLFFWCFLWFVLLVVALFDWLHYEIPMVMIWMGLFMVLIFEGWRDWQMKQDLEILGMWSVWDSQLLWGVLSGFGAFLIFTALSKGTGERLMGWGDAWLVLLLGLVTRWPGILWVITLGSGIGSLIGIAMILIRRGNLKMQVPFAPLLILGFWLIIMLELYKFNNALSLLGIGNLL